MSAATEARAFRLGQLALAIELARDGIRLAGRQRDLLPAADARALNNAGEVLTGIEQRLWAAWGKKP